MLFVEAEALALRGALLFVKKLSRLCVPSLLPLVCFLGPTAADEEDFGNDDEDEVDDDDEDEDDEDEDEDEDDVEDEDDDEDEEEDDEDEDEDDDAFPTPATCPPSAASCAASLLSSSCCCSALRRSSSSRRWISAASWASLCTRSAFSSSISPFFCW